MRVGMGYDVHKLTKERRLILGGVEIPYEYGLLGHSDADVPDMHCWAQQRLAILENIFRIQRKRMRESAV